MYRHSNCALILFILCLFVPFWGIAYAQETSLERSQIDLKPGLRLDYEGYSVVSPLRPRVREDFIITIRDLWLNGVSFSYALEQKVIGTEQGIQTLSSLDDCGSIDPWWEPMSTDFDNRCELWISKKAYRELKGTGKSWLSVDTLVRNDATVRWELIGEENFPCTIQGIPRLLHALHIQTNRGDDIFVLDDPNNPLILAIDSAYFAWKLRAITE